MVWCHSSSEATDDAINQAIAAQCNDQWRKSIAGKLSRQERNNSQLSVK